MNSLREPLRAANARLFPRRVLFAPEWIVLGVNNLCNLHCKMCDVGTGYAFSNFHHHLTGARPLNMPLPLLEKVIDQTARFFPRARLGYAFTEPGIYPHLIESLRYARDRAVRTAMTTNGLRLPKQADDLAAAGLRDLYVSLDGPPEVHDRIRGHPHSFARAFEGIERLLARGGVRVSVFCTITPWNVGRLGDLVDRFRGMPIARMGFMHTNFTTREMAESHNERFGERYPSSPSNLAQLDLDAMDLDRLGEEITALGASQAGFPLEFSPRLRDREELEVFYRRPERKIGARCSDAARTMMVKSNGDVIPAHGRCYDVVAGNLRTHDLSELWNAPALRAFRATLAREGGLLPACTRCCSAF